MNFPTLAIVLMSMVMLSACGDWRSTDAKGAQAGYSQDAAEEPEAEYEVDVNASDPTSRSVALRLYRDQYGVPHVFADDNYGVYFGYGYAVASDRLFQMEMLKRTAQGRVAEVLGATYLDLDIKLRSQYNHPVVRSQVASLSNRDREILEGYAAGFNARIAELADEDGQPLPKPFYDYGFSPSQWTAFDVASIFVGSIAHRYADFNSERDNLAFLQAMEERHGKDAAWSLFSASKWLRDDSSPTTIPRTGKRGEAADEMRQSVRPEYLDRLGRSAGVAHLLLDAHGQFVGLADNPPRRLKFRQTLASHGFDAHPEFMPASNYWAVSDLNDAPGALLNGPQFDFAVPSYVYAIGLHGGEFDVVGNTLLALPALLFAHNNDLAWGSTAGMSDLSDEFYLELNPDNPEQYRYQGGWREFERWQEVIAVAGGEPVTVIARRSNQGMVQEWLPHKHLAWVRARTWEGRELDDLMSWVWLATDRSLEAAEVRIEGKSTNINIYTMDKHGQLGYVHSGKYPQRVTGHDSRLPAPGDGSIDWQGLRPYSDNPKMRTPAQRFVTNWNNRPSEDWVSSDLWPATWSPADRVHILIDEIGKTLGGTVDEMVAINTLSAFEDVNHRYLIPLIEEVVDLPDANDRVREGGAMLRQWDKSWRADENAQFGAANTLMEAFVRHLNREVFLDDVGDDYFHLFAATNYPNKPLGAALGVPPGVRVLVKLLDDQRVGRPIVYDFLNGQSAAAVALTALLAALDELEATQGSNMQEWRLQAAPMEWTPFNFRGVPQASPENRLTFPTYQNRGSENNVFVATGTGIEGRDVNPPGQGGHLAADGSSASDYRTQFDLYNRFKYKTLPFTEQAVKTAAVSKKELTIVAH